MLSESNYSTVEFVITEQKINLRIGNRNDIFFANQTHAWAIESNRTVYPGREHVGGLNRFDLTKREELQLEAFKKSVGGKL